ncbi:hypothetical protein BU16DRAFT_559838 [Lophium mytilinum]|uniref:Uncharacterized protein n=1 Tax=Lophium mytilinum TaxID=390894 RepID=A0A6A6R2J6_9PEZI|nr:hypothetical protein BU16DRAFT_559838 [Lophium mytilinum]
MVSFATYSAARSYGRTNALFRSIVTGNRARYGPPIKTDEYEGLKSALDLDEEHRTDLILPGSFLDATNTWVRMTAQTNAEIFARVAEHKAGNVNPPRVNPRRVRAPRRIVLPVTREPSFPATALPAAEVSTLPLARKHPVLPFFRVKGKEPAKGPEHSHESKPVEEYEHFHQSRSIEVFGQVSGSASGSTDLLEEAAGAHQVDDKPILQRLYGLNSLSGITRNK